MAHNHWMLGVLTLPSLCYTSMVTLEFPISVGNLRSHATQSFVLEERFKSLISKLKWVHRPLPLSQCPLEIFFRRLIIETILFSVANWPSREVVGLHYSLMGFIWASLPELRGGGRVHSMKGWRSKVLALWHFCTSPSFWIMSTISWVQVVPRASVIVNSITHWTI